MKKLLLFFTSIAFGLSLTSCLDGGSQNFTEQSFVYIDNYQMATYGKAINGRGLIYSENPKFQMLDSKSYVFLAYSWEEENGYKAIGEQNAFNVSVGSDIIEINKTNLAPVKAPDVVPTERFARIDGVVHDPEGVFFDDNWLIQYSYIGKEGETPSVQFYLGKNTIDEDNTIQVDLRLTKSGTPKDGANEREYTNYTSVDMSFLRGTFLASSGKEIKVKFNFYKQGSDTPVVTENYYVMKAKS